jgi:hypothetical protein
MIGCSTVGNGEMRERVAEMRILWLLKGDMSPSVQTAAWMFYKVPLVMTALNLVGL